MAGNNNGRLTNAIGESLSPAAIKLTVPYREMLERLARESGVETPTAENLARLERKRKGKKLSNTDWVSKSDPEAKIAKMKDGTTHLAYKPEHAVDLDTGAVVAAELHPADEGDTTTLSKTLAKAEANLEAVDAAPTSEDPAECVADKGYHSRAVLRALNDSPWKTRIAAHKQTGFSRWHGDDAARRAVTNNRARLKSGVAREAFKLRAEIVERCFAHNLDRGGMRRTWLRGRQNVHKRYLLHVAGHNLSLLMRQLIGAGTIATSHLSQGPIYNSISPILHIFNGKFAKFSILNFAIHLHPTLFQRRWKNIDLFQRFTERRR